MNVNKRIISINENGDDKMMNNKSIDGAINVTNLDATSQTAKIEGCELDVSKEIINSLKMLAKSLTEENGNDFLLELPEGLSVALSKVLLNSLEKGNPWVGIVSLVSVAACKYFFSIHSQLEDINKKLTEIIDFLATDKLCELVSQLKFLQFYYNNYEYIVTNEKECSATIVQIQSTKKIALQNVLFYEKYLSRHLHNASNSKNALIDEAKSFLENAENYRYSAEVYCLSQIMELIFSQNYNKNLIQNVKKEISEIIKTVNMNLSESMGAMKRVLNSKKFNKENDIVNRIKEYEDMSERENEYRKMLDELSERVNSHTELIIKNNSLYLK